jgi:hypothetical protein
MNTALSLTTVCDWQTANDLKNHIPQQTALMQLQFGITFLNDVQETFHKDAANTKYFFCQSTVNHQQYRRYYTAPERKGRILLTSKL